MLQGLAIATIEVVTSISDCFIFFSRPFFLFLFLLFCKSDHKNSLPEVVDHKSSKLNAMDTAETLKLEAVDTLLYVMGKFDPVVHPLFAKLPTVLAAKEGMYLRIEAIESFMSMAQSAAKVGLKLKILSATRNFTAQKTIWENKWNGKVVVENGQNLALTTPDPITRAKIILEYSSMPGTSRHHWGTDIDLNALNNIYFTTGEGKKIYDWLLEYAGSFGFCQPYTADRPYGYQEEKWHWTYMPISKPLTEFCGRKLSNNRITGFKGSQTAIDIDVVKNYVLGINHACR